MNVPGFGVFRRLYLREGFINQLIELGVHAIEAGAEWEPEDGVVAREHRHGGSEDSRLQTRDDLRFSRLRLKGLIFRPPRTHRYFVAPYGCQCIR
jgi:hypothetical protein